ncbi:MAG: hypothetical protein GY874_08760 [Desulfobacteraceae bacterium]|nr:hypothetical protein [Desulfobacteraceae bacterium]
MEYLKNDSGYSQKQICHPIRANVRLSEAPANKDKTIFEFDGNAADANDYHKLARKTY